MSEYYFAVNQEAGTVTEFGSEDVRKAYLPQSSAVVATSGGMNVLRPPYDFQNLSALYDYNSTHKLCINLKANLTVGLGYEVEKAVPQEIKDALLQPNNNFGESWTNLCFRLKLDKEIFGRFALEIVRVGDKVAFYHVPANEVYVVQEGNTPRVAHYVQRAKGSPRDKVFKKYSPKRSNGSQLFVWEEYNPNSRFYGIPDYVTAIKSILGNDTIATYMLNFFENNARPDYFIIITGTTLTPEQKASIENALRNTKGVANAHRLVTMTLGNPQARVEVKEMSKVIDENFRNTKLDNRDEIAQIHGVPPKILGISSAGSLGSGNEAIGALKILMECVIEPSRREMEEVLNLMLAKEFGYTGGKIFSYKTISLVNEKDLAIIHKTYIGEGIMSVNEARKEINKPILQGDEYDKIEARPYNRSMEINPDDMTNLDPTKDITQTNE